MRLYVGNISYQATESDLKDWFAQAGLASEAVKIIRDRTSGDSRGFGFVELPSGVDAEAIAGLNGRDMPGRNLVISQAHVMEPGSGGRPRREAWRALADDGSGLPRRAGLPSRRRR